MQLMSNERVTIAVFPASVEKSKMMGANGGLSGMLKQIFFPTES